MGTSIFIAKIFALVYLIIGAAFLINRKAFVRVMEDYPKNAALVFFMGIFTLVLGIVLVLVHNIWVANWTVIITLIGWIGLFKGIWLIMFPDSVDKFMQAYLKNQKFITVHMIGALIFGAVLAYFAFCCR